MDIFQLPNALFPHPLMDIFGRVRAGRDNWTRPWSSTLVVLYIRLNFKKHPTLLPFSHKVPQGCSAPKATHSSSGGEWATRAGTYSQSAKGYATQRSHTTMGQQAPQTHHTVRVYLSSQQLGRQLGDVISLAIACVPNLVVW